MDCDDVPGYAKACTAHAMAIGPGGSTPRDLVDFDVYETSATDWPYTPLPNVYLPVGWKLNMRFASDAAGRSVATWAFYGVQAD